jgi:hypothetical protein
MMRLSMNETLLGSFYLAKKDLKGRGFSRAVPNRKGPGL